MAGRRCPRCGTVSPPGNRFCGRCGWAFGRPYVPPPLGPPYTALRWQIDPLLPPPRRDLRWTLIVLGIALVVVGILMLVVGAIVQDALGGSGGACAIPGCASAGPGAWFTWIGLPFLLLGIGLAAVGFYWALR